MAGVLNGPSRPSAITLLLDFDGTLTKKDTMHVLADAGYSSQQKCSDAKQSRPWTEIVDAYTSDFNGHMSTYLPKREDRTTLVQEIAWLSSLKPTEDASAERVRKAGIFDNVSIPGMQETANNAVDTKRVELRAGLTELFAYIDQHNASLLKSRRPLQQFQVISVNWSALFVKEVLLRCIQQSGDGDGRTQWYWSEGIAVHANELPSLVKEGIQLGRPSRLHAEPKVPTSVRTSHDKVQIAKTLRHELYNSMPYEDQTIIYVGDSSTDLECLLAADIGICIRDEVMGSGQKELAETFTRLGIRVIHIQDSEALAPPVASKEVHQLFWVRDFSDVKLWLEKKEAGMKS